MSAQYLLLRSEDEARRVQERCSLLFDSCLPPADELDAGDHRYAVVADARGDGALAVLRQRTVAVATDGGAAVHRRPPVVCTALVVARIDALREVVALLRRLVDAVAVPVEANPGRDTRVHLFPGVRAADVDIALAGGRRSADGRAAIRMGGGRGENRVNLSRTTACRQTPMMDDPRQPSATGCRERS